ncbi:hypothetical protein CRM22_003632 [Opisthorchis felineus]|uniref:H15 domain-containing protein n=1 Tax=Opisthorchis felineus TaxID=147828 RepID=A0A4S2M0A3_OPIFE|nr:hypothetical protein CRM22_003632 [Opisthorchis felineus]
MRVECLFPQLRLDASFPTLSAAGHFVTGRRRDNLDVLVSVCCKRLMGGVSAPASAPAISKKPKSAKLKIPEKHPPVIDRAKASINAAKDRKGTSLPTIKKFIAANYKVDVEKLGPHIRRGIVHAVEKGILFCVHNKGKGASGSFKVAEKKTATKQLQTIGQES